MKYIISSDSIMKTNAGGVKMAKFKFYASTGYVGSMVEEVLEIPDDELEGMSEEEKYEYIYNTYFEGWLLTNNIDMGFYEEKK